MSVLRARSGRCLPVRVSDPRSRAGTHGCLCSCRLPGTGRSNRPGDARSAGSGKSPTGPQVASGRCARDETPPPPRCLCRVPIAGWNRRPPVLRPASEAGFLDQPTAWYASCRTDPGPVPPSLHPCRVHRRWHLPIDDPGSDLPGYACWCSYPRLQRCFRRYPEDGGRSLS